jgi:hypothetical protein
MTTPLGKPRLISGDPTHLLERFSVADQTALDPRAPILQNYISLHLLRFDIRCSMFDVSIPAVTAFPGSSGRILRGPIVRSSYTNYGVHERGDTRQSGNSPRSTGLGSLNLDLQLRIYDRRVHAILESHG